MRKLIAISLCAAMLAISSCGTQQRPQLVAGPIELAEAGTLSEPLQLAVRSALEEFDRQNLKRDGYQISLYETDNLYHVSFHGLQTDQGHVLGCAGPKHCLWVKVDKDSNAVADWSFVK